jgi:RHS repeat-associated protein
MTDGIGQTVYSYKAITVLPQLGAGQLESIDGPWANDTISYTYDQLGRGLSRSINGTANETTVAYDSLGRVTSTVNPLGTFSLQYVGVTGRLDYVDYPNQQRVDFDYYPNTAPGGTGNGSQRLKQIKNLGVGAGGTGSVISQFDYGYDVLGRIVSWTQANADQPQASKYELGYDGSDQLADVVIKNAVTDAVEKNTQYRYDAAGNRTVTQTDGAPRQAVNDHMNRLLSESAGGRMLISGSLNESASVKIGGVNARVDSSGKFEGETPVTIGSNTIEIRAKDASGNETVKSFPVTVPSGPAKEFGYDLNGNQTGATGVAGGDRTYEWDAADRLVAIHYTGTTKHTRLTYDGSGRWVKLIEEDNGTTKSEKRFIWDGLSLAEERDATNQVTRRYFGSGEQRNGLNYYNLTDHLGSIREVTDASGALQVRYGYDAYGTRTRLGGAGSFESDNGFTGHYYHAPSGLSMAPLRSYAADVGEWTSRDPIAEAGGLNLYAYVGNDPVNFTDPTGLLYTSSAAMARMEAAAASRAQAATRLARLLGSARFAVGGVVGAAMIGATIGTAINEIPAVRDLTTDLMYRIFFKIGDNELVRQNSPTATQICENLEEDPPAPLPATDGAGARKGPHGNSLLSERTTVLYSLWNKQTGEFLKWGITSNRNMQDRYSKEYMRNLEMLEVARGSRYEMYQLEQELIRKAPGPWNKR